MAVTLAVILTYLITEYMSHFKRQNKHNEQYSISLPANKALFIRNSDQDVNYIITTKNPITKGTVVANENTLIILVNDADVSHITGENKTNPIAKDTVLPVKNLLIIKSSDCDDAVGEKTRQVAIDTAKKLSMFRYLKRRRLFKRNKLGNTFRNVFSKSSLFKNRNSQIGGL